MILAASKLSEEIRRGANADPNAIAIVPTPDLKAIELSGEASVSLRLGRWFVTMRQSRETHIQTTHEGNGKEGRFSKQHFVPFGQSFIVHPGRFLLAGTLEWIRLPMNYSALVLGKSSLGRRGIIIETAAGVHPGFSGCLTLEIANVGEVPVELVAGMSICQLFVHQVDDGKASALTPLAGQRKPRLGPMRKDDLLERLRKSAR